MAKPNQVMDKAKEPSSKKPASGAVRSPRGGANFELTGKRAGQGTSSSRLKKSSIERARALDMPPTPRGCEWRATEDGWNLFRCWKEQNGLAGKTIKKDRYAGHLGREAWEVMKEYDYETFIAAIA